MSTIYNTGDNMKFINLTPHEITIQGRSFPPSGMVARVVDRELREIFLDGIPVTLFEGSSGDSTLLPKKEEGVILIVSRAVAQVVRRDDVYFPTDFVRNSYGTVTECRRLAQFYLGDKEDSHVK